MKKHFVGTLLTLLILFLCTPGNSLGTCSPAPVEKIDINLDSAVELQKLPGIGPAMAKRIIDYREANGPFERIEDLMEVKGIGEKRFLTLREMVTVKPAVKERKD